MDSAGTNHGTPSNGVAFVAGNVGQAFALNGVNQSIAIPDAPALRPSSVTLEAWLKLNTTAGIQAIFSKPVGSGSSKSYLLYLNGGRVMGRIGDITGAGDILSGPVLTTERWYHVAYTFDGDYKQQFLYLDGVRVASGAGNKSIGYDAQSLLLGRDSENGAPRFFLNGSLDESAIYNRVLSGEEIVSIYNAGPAGKSIAGPYIDSPPQLPEAYAGQAYSYALTTPRGTAPFGFTLGDGALPPGLALDAAGLIGGVPSNSGIFNFVARVTDAGALFSERTFTLQVFERITPPAGLIAWWRGEGNVLDSAGANHGMLPNGVTYTPGKVGQAFSLSGLGQAVVIPDAPALRPASLTLEAWVSFDSRTGLQFIFAKPLGDAANESYALWWSGDFFGSVVGGADQGLALFAPFTPTLGRWYHVACIFDDPFDVHAIYIDGLLAARAVVTQSIAYDTQPVFLGRNTENGVPNYFFQGRIDEASIYNRSLSEAEIASIYSAGPLGKRIRTILPPLLLSVSRQGEFISISFDASSGQSYTVEYADALEADVWSPLTNITATGTNGVSFDSIANSPQRFYRVFTLNN